MVPPRADRPLGRSGIRISPIVMGLWQAGKEMWAGIDDAETRRAIRAAVEVGINAFDTAEVYGRGHSERMLAAATAGLRDQVVYCTKVFANHLRYDQVIAACERSLQNLRTDRIDLYQIHWPSTSFSTPRVPIAETMAALNDLQAQGKIRAIGVSNFSRAQLEEALAWGRIDSLQPPYSLFWRHVERDAAAFCREHGITILAYSPLAQGILAGRFGVEPRFAAGDHRAKNRLFRPEIYPRVLSALEQLRPIAARRSVGLAQLALAWVIAQPGTCAVAGARNEAQVRENAAAMDVRLDEADLEALDRISRGVTDFLDDNPVPWDF
ncbi:MAG: aldo/keto reductase [Desulfobacterales bacterium]